jgi:hypothetical protein
MVEETIKSALQSVRVKPCRDCKEIKPLDQFAKKKACKNGRDNECKVCAAKRMKAWNHANPGKSKTYINKSKRKDTVLKWTFGISLHQYNEILIKQDSKCAVCTKPRSAFTIDFAVDHDHSCCPGNKSCGKCVRGLLCRHCNTAYGLLNEDTKIIENLLKYHHNHKENK